MILTKSGVCLNAFGEWWQPEQCFWYKVAPFGSGEDDPEKARDANRNSAARIKSTVFFMGAPPSNKRGA